MIRRTSLMLQQDVAAKLLRRKHVAIVGLSSDPSKPSNHVAHELLEQHYHNIIPVRPGGGSVMGLTCVNSLSELPETLDRNDLVAVVFRKPSDTLEVVEDAKRGNVNAVWFQLEVAHASAVAKAETYGMDVVKDKCFWIEFRDRRRELGL